MQFYFAQDDQQKGPIDAGQLRAAGVRPDTLVWREGMAEWQEAARVPELAGLFAGGASEPSPAADPLPPPPAHVPQPYGPAGAYGVPGSGPYVQPGVAPQLNYGGYTGPLQSSPPQALSVTSLVLGIIALPTTCFYGLGILLAILAVIFGHVGHAQYKRATGQSSGMAVAGLVCGYISLALTLILFIVVFYIASAMTYGN